MHRKDVVDNQCALLDKQRFRSLSAAADGQRRVSCGLPRVGGYDRMQAQGCSTCQRWFTVSFLFLSFFERGVVVQTYILERTSAGTPSASAALVKVAHRHRQTALPVSAFDTFQALLQA